MSENRIRRTAVAAALVAGTWGAFSTARAQASGTLQASVTVIDDAVSRAVTAEIPGYLSAPVGSSGIRRPRAVQLEAPGAPPDPQGVRATIRELPAGAGARRVRVDIVYLQ